MSKSTIIRTIVLLAALVNQALVLAGKSPVPYSNEEIEAGVTALVTVIVSLWSWWKNNSVTKEAKKADEYLVKLKKTK